MKKIYITTLRLNLGDVEDHEAWEHLQRMDKKEYRSVSKAVVAAVNAYFSRKELLDADPYLETREKEDAFLQEIRDAVRSGLQAAVPISLGTVLQNAPLPTPSEKPAEEADENMDVALDFADSF